MPKNTGAGLLPWVVGGALSSAIPIAGATDLPAAPVAAISSGVGQSPARPTAELPAAAALAGGSDTKATVVSAVPRTALPQGQVWQCVVNGQRIFSDSRCGDHASIRQLREVNVMDSPAFSPAPAYRPDVGGYPSAPLDEAPSDYANDPEIGQEVFLVHERGPRAQTPKHPNTVHPRRKN